MNADRTADWTSGERLHAILAQEINDAPAEELIQAVVDDVLRGWAARIRETGTAKGWGTWAAEYMDPDVPFDDTGMPSTETIVAELRRLDRAAVLREVAERLLAERRHHISRAVCDGITYASDRLTEWADETEQEKDTSGGDQPSEGERPVSVGQTYWRAAEPTVRVKVCRVWQNEGDDEPSIAFDTFGRDWRGRPYTTHSALRLSLFRELYRYDTTVPQSGIDAPAHATTATDTAKGDPT